MRQRGTLVRYAGSHIQHMQKALRQMNLLLDNVVSDITGKTGMTIIRAILKGEYDPERLAAYRDGRCKRSEQEIAQSLRGHYREEHLFSLRQSVELYDTYTAHILSCDEAIEQQLKRFDEQGDPEQLAVSKKQRAADVPAFDVRGELYRMCGVDLTTIDGVSDIIALKVLSEIGTDMNRWKSEKHFASWAGLSPGNKVSGGKILSSKTKPTTNRVAAALRMSAFALSNSKSALGAYYRRMRSRHGAPKAITATAHKLARLIYSMLKHGTEYVDQGQDYYEQQYQDRVMKNLKRRAAQMGFALVPSREDNGLVSEISMA